MTRSVPEIFPNGGAWTCEDVRACALDALRCPASSVCQLVWFG
jgi:hypothetical protein